MLTGLEDLACGRETEAALVVAMAAPRLRALGIAVPDGGGPFPSHRLYELLAEGGAGAHGRYNALVASSPPDVIPEFAWFA